MHTLSILVALAIAGPVAAGSAVLDWTPPVLNTDGTPLTDLAGFRVSWGCNGSGSYAWERVILQPNLRSFVIEDLPNTGTCYFRVNAVNSGRVNVVNVPSTTSAESAPSNEASKAMNANPPRLPYTRNVAFAPGPGAPALEVLPPARLRIAFAGDPLVFSRDATSSPTRAELRAEFLQSGEQIVVPFTTATVTWAPPFAGLWSLSLRSCNANGCGEFRNALEDGALFFFKVKPPTGGGIDP